MFEEPIFRIMISIFIPTYDGEKYLAKTLDSVIAQTYRDFEIVCVDDQSTDSTFEILKSFAEKDSRIRIFQKQNEGDVPHSWQYAFPLLRGEFTLYMSQDDMLSPEALEKMIIRQKETNADAVLPVVAYYEADKSINECHCYRGVDGNISKILTGKEAFGLMLDYTISGFALWNTELIKRVGIRVEAYNSDEVAQREWIANCKIVAFSDALFYYRRDNSQAITRTFTIRNLYRSISEARLIALAAQYQLDTEIIQNHRNEYFRNLWWNASYMIQHNKDIPAKERARLKATFSKAYHILHQEVTLQKWYYKLSVISEPLFWITQYIKLYIARFRSDRKTN